jgi:hypothetical protein
MRHVTNLDICISLDFGPSLLFSGWSACLSNWLATSYDRETDSIINNTDECTKCLVWDLDLSLKRTICFQSFLTEKNIKYLEDSCPFALVTWSEILTCDLLSMLGRSRKLLWQSGLATEWHNRVEWKKANYDHLTWYMGCCLLVIFNSILQNFVHWQQHSWWNW